MRPDSVLITDRFLPHIGGSRIYYHKVATLLGGAMAVVTGKCRGDTGFDASASYPIKRVNLRGRVFPGPAGIGEAVDSAALAMAARAFGAPGCFLAGEVKPSAFAAFAAARRRGVGYGVFLHDEPLMGAGRIEAALRLLALRAAGAIIVSSGFPRERAAECLGDAVRIFYAPPGVDTQRFSPGRAEGYVLEAHGVKPGGYILSVGRLVPYKNISALLSAVAALSSGELSLVIVGEGPHRAILEDEAKSLGLGDRVVFAGRVSDGDLVQLYRGALAYVFPSRRVRGLQHEGVGMAALEAASCGCPVVASTATSATDFVADGETGFIFDPEEEGALSAVIRRLIEDGALRKKAASAVMERVRREYTWERTAWVVEEAIEHIGKASRRPVRFFVKTARSGRR